MDTQREMKKDSRGSSRSSAPIDSSSRLVLFFHYALAFLLFLSVPMLLATLLLAKAVALII